MLILLLCHSQSHPLCSNAPVEALRADHQVELERAEPDDMSEQALQECYQVHGQFYSRLRWRR